MNFNSIAPIYDNLVRIVFGAKLFQSRRLLLDQLATVERTLIIGGGSGDMLFGLAERQICKQVVYLEASDRFLAQAKDSWEQKFTNFAPPPVWMQSSWQAYNPTTKFDLITTDYLLDLFPTEELSELVKRLSLWLKAEGSWLYIDFCQYEQTAWWWRPLRWLMYRFFAIFSSVPGRKLSNVKAMAHENGFQIVAHELIAYQGIEAILFRRNPMGEV